MSEVCTLLNLSFNVGLLIGAMNCQPFFFFSCNTVIMVHNWKLKFSNSEPDCKI